MRPSETQESKKLVDVNDAQELNLRKRNQISKLIPLGLVAIMSVIQGILALIWGPHWLGLGIALCELVYCLIAFVWVRSLRTKSPPSKLRLFIFSLFLTIFAIIALMYLAVYIMCYTAAPPIGIFPESCPKPTNCVRLTQNGTNDNNSEDLTLPVLNMSRALIEGKIKQWVMQNLYVTVYDADNLIQVRAVTIGMGFVDDFFAEIVDSLPEAGNGTFTINVQSQSRIGVHDFGVNKARVKSFLQALTTKVGVTTHLGIL